MKILFCVLAMKDYVAIVINETVFYSASIVVIDAV